MMRRILMPVLLGASLGAAAPHAASAQKLGDVVNGLAGREVVPMRDRGSDRDAYERGRADAYREPDGRYDDDRGRRDDAWRHRDDDRRRQADIARHDADAAQARADEARARAESYR